MNMIRKCTADDLTTLQEISRKTYHDTFAHLNSKANMKTFLETAYNIEKLCSELSNNNSSFYFLYIQEELAGYLKLNESPAQTDLYDPNSMEIERIFVIRAFQGQGLGSFLINEAMRISRTCGKSYIWLGVWEKNNKAIQFYNNKGFYKIGQHPYFLGQEEQTDYIMRKDL